MVSDSSSSKASYPPISVDVVPPKPTLSSYKNMSSEVGVNVGVVSSVSSSMPNSSSEGIWTMVQRDEVTIAKNIMVLTSGAKSHFATKLRKSCGAVF